MPSVHSQPNVDHFMGRTLSKQSPLKLELMLRRKIHYFPIKSCPRRRLQVLSAEEQMRAASSDYNFDHPDAFDFDLLTDILRKLKQGKSVKIPVYDFTTHGRQKEWVRTDARTCRWSVFVISGIRDPLFD